MNPATINTIIGIVGAVITLFAFILNQTGKLTVDDVRYDALNTLGSGILLVYAILIGSLPFVVINTVWGGVSLKDVIKRQLKGRKVKFTL
jgi:hypothetical protein